MQLWDTDGDGLADDLECLRGTDPSNPDSDGDGAKDGDEVAAGSDPSAQDSDGDGLPDAWERALAVRSGGQLGLDQINPGDDLDADGLSNLNEYLAGTYAYDAQDGFTLKIAEAQGTRSVLEFVTVRGRAYSILGSTDMEHWIPVAFRLAGDPVEGGTRETLQATQVTLVRASVDSLEGGATSRFFKVKVQ